MSSSRILSSWTVCFKFVSRGAATTQISNIEKRSAGGSMTASVPQHKCDCEPDKCARSTKTLAHTLVANAFSLRVY